MSFFRTARPRLTDWSTLDNYQAQQTRRRLLYMILLPLFFDKLIAGRACVRASPKPVMVDVLINFLLFIFCISLLLFLLALLNLPVSPPQPAGCVAGTPLFLHL